MDGQNKVIIDWVSISSKIHSAENFMEDLGMFECEWQVLNGFYGYQDRYYFDGVSIHYNPRKENMGVLLEMSGQGCRNFETNGNGDYNNLFDLVKSNPHDMNITRLDIAYDDFEGLLNLSKVAKKTRAGEYVSPFREWSVESGSKGTTVSLGSRKSDAYIRMYDKAAEREIEGDLHWVRCELQLRRERAHSFAMLLLDGQPIGEIFAGVLLRYLRYIDMDATRKERCSTSTFLGEVFTGCLCDKAEDEAGGGI